MELRLTSEDIDALRLLQAEAAEFKLVRHQALCTSEFIESNGHGGCRVSAQGRRFLAWLDRRRGQLYGD